MGSDGGAGGDEDDETDHGYVCRRRRPKRFSGVSEWILRGRGGKLHGMVRKQ